ncbi:MAG: oligosaccharide flippase family protein [Clostridiales bacterium]|nr:oligosaccharide flippase family protein [Clostridiales bacterium]
MDKNAKALKSGVWYILANVIVRGMTLITTPVFSRLLTHEQYGDYSNFLSWTNIAVILVSMRMDASLISAKFDYKERLNSYNRSLVSLTMVLTAGWAVAVNVFSHRFTNLFGFGRLYTNLMLVYCLFNAIINIFQINERYAYRYKKSVFVALLVAVSTTIVSIILVVYMNDKLTGRVIGGVLPVAVIGLVLLFLFFRNERSIDVHMWSYTLKICIPYIPHLLSLQVLNSVDRIMITKICGSADNALYTIAYTCGHMVTLLMTSMNSAFAPWLGDKLNEKSYGEIKKVTKYYVLLFSGLATIMMLLAPEILLIMGGRSYLEAKYVMTPVAMGCVCQFLYTLYVNVEQFKKKTIGMAVASVLAALLNYGLNLYFIPRYGYIAAAYTTLAGYVFLLLSHIIIIRIIGEHKTFDNRFIIGLMLVMCLVTVGVNYLYTTPMIRYIVIGIVTIVIGVFSLFRWDMIKRIINKIIHA